MPPIIINWFSQTTS